MIGFFTSSPTGPLDGSYRVEHLDPKNGFIEQLHHYWKPNCKVCMVASNPIDDARNDQMIAFFSDVFQRAGLSYQCFDVIDHRSVTKSVALYDCVILAGGHVPTQHAFFEHIHLREQLDHYSGIVIGISAGSMNSASLVYVQPEEEGESASSFERFKEGLHLHDAMIIPHYQMIQHYQLDGKRLFEDITYPDSNRYTFLCLCDGSYLLVKLREHTAMVYGESYLIHNGQKTLFCKENEHRQLY